MRLFILLILALLVLAFLFWAFMPRRHLPRFRVASMRLRLRLRLHPGRGFATVPELWLQWGRFASFRESARCRPALGFSRRATSPAEHSVYFGRAHYRHGLRVPIQENTTLVGRSRSGKSGWLQKVIIRWPGAVVSATTKTELFKYTSGLRQQPCRPGLVFSVVLRLAMVLRAGRLARLGRRLLDGEPRPVFLFNPEQVGQARSNIRFDLVSGCEDATVAMRRGTSLTDSVRVKGTEDDGFWNEQASLMMPALLSAAAFAGKDMFAVARWIVSGDTREPERTLRAGGRGLWADAVAQMRGPADKTGATVRMVLTAAVKFMQNPALAVSALPGPDGGFDIHGFLRRKGTLYLVADQRHDTSPVAPLFACLVSEIHAVACQMAAAAPGDRLDPPLLLQLDEVTRICPVPVPAMLADSGGRGITMQIAGQGLAQIEERWGKPATRSILDTSNQVYLSGVADPDTLDMVSKLCGDASYRERGEGGKVGHHAVATPAMIRRLPRRRALILRGSCAPVITHLPMVWNDWHYRMARLRRQGPAAITPVAVPVQDRALAGLPQLTAWQDAITTAAAAEVTTDLADHEGTVPAAVVNGSSHTPAANGNGHVAHPWDRS